MTTKKLLIISILIFWLVSSLTFSYTVEVNEEVHQHLTNESQNVWKSIPIEIKNHLKNKIQTNINPFLSVTSDFNLGDDTITASAEEDIRSRPKNHFWQPDTPEIGFYNDGINTRKNPLASFQNQDSSYTTAKNLWTAKVIPLYLKGNINESYYWLGRIAHLLEDASQPSHVHLDCHPDSSAIGYLCEGTSGGDNGADDSVLEQYTGNNFQTCKILTGKKLSRNG